MTSLTRRTRSTTLAVLLLLSIGLLSIAASAGAQVPTGNITGRAVDDSGAGLPGITVTATSDSVQGDRAASPSESSREHGLY